MPYAAASRRLFKFQSNLLCGQKIPRNLRMLRLHFLLDLRMLLLLLFIDPLSIEKAIPKREIQGVVILRPGRQVKCQFRKYWKDSYRLKSCGVHNSMND